MTEQVVQEEEVQANPYNQNKAWHKEDMKPFVSSDSLFFKEETPEQPSEESVEEVEVEAESKDKPYKRPNYNCLLYTSPSPRDQRGSGNAWCG